MPKNLGIASWIAKNDLELADLCSNQVYHEFCCRSTTKFGSELRWILFEFAASPSAFEARSTWVLSTVRSLRTQSRFEDTEEAPDLCVLESGL